MSTQAVPTSHTASSEGALNRLWGLFDRLGELPAWVVSAGVHLLVLFLLAGLTRVTLVETRKPIESTMEELELDQYKFENATLLDEVGNDSPVNMASPSKAAATEVGREPTEMIEKRLTEEFALDPVPMQEMIPEPNQMDLTADFDVAGTTENVGGVEGAVDILTQELASSLRENETTVIWMFDASLSLKKRRDTIADRFERIYEQLGQMRAGGGKEDALMTIAASYGRTWNLLTDQPTSDIKAVAEQIRKIPADESGEENVFSAVSDVTQKFLSQRSRERRNMLIFIVTDERGDDAGNLESLITRLKRYGIRVYCVGNAAPLGREKGFVSWEYDDGFVEPIAVDQGPESIAPQLVDLPYWGGGSPGLLSSGYGPYAMTRLCAETGGLYLITDDTAHKFDPGVMRKYAPDYRPVAQFDAQLRSNLAKKSLVAASVASQEANRQNAIPQPQTVFPAQNDTVLRQAITEAQKPMAVTDYHLAELGTLLESGLRDRDKLDSPRWRAAFDLAVGRVLALRARAFGYNTVLADMKIAPKPFEKQNSNQWVLKPSREISAGPAVKKLAEQAQEALARVIDEHPGTPWAELAAKELGTPMGWQWVERNDLVAKFGPKANDPQVAQLLLAEEEKKKAEMKPKPAGPKREKPKL